MKKCMFILAALLAFTGLIACGSSADNTAASPSAPSSGEDFSEASSAMVTTDAQSVPEKHLNIVTTIFPEYDWVREILGDNAENADLTMLLDNGVDLHSYQPTAQDILKISTCDLFIYVGGESDGWVSDALQEAANKDMKVIDLLDVLDDAVKEEEKLFSYFVLLRLCRQPRQSAAGKTRSTKRKKKAPNTMNTFGCLSETQRFSAKLSPAP
mgnify:CR=1 FL=1